MTRTVRGKKLADRVCVGAIAAAHGIRGQVAIKAFTAEPENVAAYGPVETDDGRTLTLKVTGRTGKGLVLATVIGVADRNGAEALKGQQLYVPRAALPADEEDETYYHADLIGLVARDTEGRELGVVKAVHNFGAGDILVVEGPGGEVTVPFTAAAVPVVDIAGGALVIDPPAEVDGAEVEGDKR